MDDEEIEIVERPQAHKHDKWSFIVLAFDLAHNVMSEITDTLGTATTLLLQHREHKIEESEFYEIVGE